MALPCPGMKFKWESDVISGRGQNIESGSSIFSGSEKYIILGKVNIDSC